MTSASTGVGVLRFKRGGVSLATAFSRLSALSRQRRRDILAIPPLYLGQPFVNSVAAQ